MQIFCQFSSTGLETCDRETNSVLSKVNNTVVNNGDDPKNIYTRVVEAVDELFTIETNK